MMSDQDPQPFVLYDFQREFLRAMLENQSVVLFKGRRLPDAAELALQRQMLRCIREAFEESSE